jgi:hypothetical protein
LQDEEVIIPDEVGEELEKEREEQQADMHAVDVRIGGDDDPVVAQSVEPVFNVQSRLEEVKLLVLIDNLLGEAIGIERFAFEREDGLRLHVTRRGQGAGSRVALDDEERAFLRSRIFVAEMKAAIAASRT